MFRIAIAALAVVCFVLPVSAQNVTPPAIGTPSAVADWSVAVTAIYDDPTQIDPTATWFTDWLAKNAPPAGETMFSVRLRLTNSSDRAADPATALRFSLASGNGFVYDFRATCGGVPGQLPPMTQVDAGETVETVQCWRVRTEHLPTLRLRVDLAPEIAGSSDPVWFSLSDSEGTPVP